MDILVEGGTTGLTGNDSQAINSNGECEPRLDERIDTGTVETVSARAKQQNNKQPGLITFIVSHPREHRARMGHPTS